MLRAGFLLLCIYVPVAYSLFAKELWNFSILHRFEGRVVEFVVLPKHARDIAYISFSEERNFNKTAGQTGLDDAVASNPMIAKVVLGGEGEVKWSTPITEFVANTRFSSLALSQDEKELFLTGTLINEMTQMLYVQNFDTVNGNVTDSFFVALSGSNIIRSTAVDKTGIYICGRSSNTTEADVHDAKRDMLLGKVSLNGSVVWRHTKKIADKACQAIQVSNGFVYTAGTSRNGTLTDSGIVYKHFVNGTVVWGKRISNTVGLPLQPMGIVASEDGIFVGSRFSASAAPKERVLMQKVSSGGTLLWTREVGTGGNPVGMGYWRGFVHCFVVGEKVLARVSQYGEVETAGVDIRVGQAGWAGERAVTVSTELEIRVYEVEEGVADARRGRFGYRLVLSIRAEGELEGVADYLEEITRGGKVSARPDEGGAVYVVVVRGDDIDGLEAAVERVKAALRKVNGTSAMERDLGIVVEAGDMVVERGIEGRGVNVAVVVGVVIGVGFVSSLVMTWFCVTKTFTRLGERVMMI